MRRCSRPGLSSKRKVSEKTLNLSVAEAFFILSASSALQILEKPEVKKTSQIKRHHIDRRAHHIVADDGASPDDLLDTPELADWLGVSHQWLEIGRNMGYGPKFKKLSSRMVRYRRGDVIAWLDERSHTSTAEYPRRKSREVA